MTLVARTSSTTSPPGLPIPGANAADWGADAWAFARAQLPKPPASVIEIGCGPDGGFVPRLIADGYEAIGVDPTAPVGDMYRRIAFEEFQPPQRAHAVIASLSLHHVIDLQRVIGRIAASLVPGGVVIVTEWSWERFDAPTARWYFNRLPPAPPDADFLHQRQHEWLASNLPWDTYYQRWAQRQEHCHTGAEIMRELGAHFDTRICTEGPYFYGDLLDTSELAEQAAIDAGTIQPTGIRYSGCTHVD